MEKTGEIEPCERSKVTGMDEQLEQLVLQVQRSPLDTPARQQAIAALIDQILKTRRISRSRPGHPLSPIHQEILQSVRLQLHERIEQPSNSYQPQRTPVREWAAALRDQAFQTVLNRNCLQQLALEVQKYPSQTPEWQYGVHELIDAIRLSGKLARQKQLPLEIYQDAVNQTLLWVCQNLQSYNLERGEFVAWVNYRLDMIARSIQQQQKDPYTQAVQGKIIRTKYQLNSLVKRIQRADLLGWLELHLKQVLPDPDMSLTIIIALSLLLYLALLIKQNPNLESTLLFEIAQRTIPHSLTVTPVEDIQVVEAIAQPADDHSSLVDELRHYLEEDHDKLFQKHIRDHPNVTFQVIALARLEGKSWKELSDTYGVGIATLSNFFQRSLKTLAPQIREAIQDS